MSGVLRSRLAAHDRVAVRHSRHAVQPRIGGRHAAAGPIPVSTSDMMHCTSMTTRASWRWRRHGDRTAARCGCSQRRRWAPSWWSRRCMALTSSSSASKRMLKRSRLRTASPIRAFFWQPPTTSRGKYCWPLCCPVFGYTGMSAQRSPAIRRRTIRTVPGSTLMPTRDFGNAVRAVIAATDTAAADASETVRRRMMTAFIRCCQYEWLFWDGAYQLRGWPVGA